MILYYVSGACSLANHIALIEANMAYELVSIGRDKRTDDGRDFLTINPKGCVPTLELDDGTVLTENLAILAYIGEQQGALLPAAGLARWRALEATSFMTTEVHGNFKPLFYPDTTQAEKDTARHKLVKHFATLATQLGNRPFLLGEQMTIADPYLFVMLRWAANFGIEVSGRFGTYLARMTSLPSVARALAEERLS
ncbi:Glutathione S-transferase [Labilithrix luteola]|uniref:Glutathione S-transferase n=1 Tax=Labilithrix luteola TaxID=1391654 RepID=A0A0K1PZY8_9BACT|nr:glutathione S-transferase C-terminal domain-containing protein [Labilithrix luteola]AKU99093.1 Glutathione S-transferase [Labilithrix luteola]